MNKVILSDNREIEVKKATVGMLKTSQQLYKSEIDREIYVVSQCSGLEMPAVEELELSDYKLLVTSVFDMGK